MPVSRIQSLKIRAKLLQKAKAKAGKPVRLKEAFTLLARASGFSSWQDLKTTLNENGPLCPPGHSAHWKIWYASYSEACSHLKAHGGFLLPYQRDFFICDLDYLNFLGLSADDPDLKEVGTNWVEPGDLQAFKRLLKKVRNRNESPHKSESKNS